MHIPAIEINIRSEESPVQHSGAIQIHIGRELYYALKIC